MKTLACISVIVVLALIPASAVAAPVWNATHYTDQEIEHDVRLAGDYWHMLDYVTGPGCTNTYMADMSNDYSAWGDGSNCSIWLNRTYWPVMTTIERCRLIVHEVGHVIGKDHVDDPTNVMYGGPLDQMVVPQCEPGYVIAQPKPRCRTRRKHGSIRSSKDSRRRHQRCRSRCGCKRHV